MIPDGKVIDLPGGADVKELSRRLVALEYDLIEHLYLYESSKLALSGTIKRLSK
jgi:hypothetical protein